MPRRLLALIALTGALTVIACQGAPTAPLLTDPKEILTQSVLSLVINVGVAPAFQVRIVSDHSGE